MNTTNVTGLQVVVAAVVALSLTWAASWSFVDSTRVARWVQAASVASEVVAGEAGNGSRDGAVRTALIQ
jgi:hypothetical protein